MSQFGIDVRCRYINPPMATAAQVWTRHANMTTCSVPLTHMTSGVSVCPAGSTWQCAVANVVCGPRLSETVRSGACPSQGATGAHVTAGVTRALPMNHCRHAAADGHVWSSRLAPNDSFACAFRQHNYCFTRVITAVLRPHVSTLMCHHQDTNSFQPEL
jgi:hypothetical protein